MREIRALDAKARLPQLLDKVERGEAIIVTRHGRAIARIVPEADRRRREIDRALAGIKRLGSKIGKQHGPLSAEEIVTSIRRSTRRGVAHSRSPVEAVRLRKFLLLQKGLTQLVLRHKQMVHIIVMAGLVPWAFSPRT